MIYGYLRVSTDLQDVNNQKESFKSYELTTGTKIDKYIEDEGVSGTVEYEERNLGKLLRQCKKGDTIIAAEVSRFGRNLFMIMRFLETCMKKELKIKTIKDGYDLTDSIQSKVLAFAFGLAAEIEREMFLKRSRESKARFMARGGIQRPRARAPRFKLAKFDKELRQLCHEGKSLANIARAFGVSRETVGRYIEVMGIEHQCTEHHRDFNTRNAQNHRATARTLSDCRSAIEYGIRQHFTYKQIHAHVKKCFPHTAIAEKSIRFYIQRDPYLLELWVNSRNKELLEANMKATWKQSKRLMYERELETVNDKLAKLSTL